MGGGARGGGDKFFYLFKISNDSALSNHPWPLLLEGGEFLFNHAQELLLRYNPNPQLLSLLKLRRPHILASEDKRCFAADAANVLSTILLDNGFVLIATMMGKNTTNHDALSS